MADTLADMLREQAAQIAAREARIRESDEALLEVVGAAVKSGRAAVTPEAARDISRARAGVRASERREARQRAELVRTGRTSQAMQEALEKYGTANAAKIRQLEGIGPFREDWDDFAQVNPEAAQAELDMAEQVLGLAPSGPRGTRGFAGEPRIMEGTYTTPDGRTVPFFTNLPEGQAGAGAPGEVSIEQPYGSGGSFSTLPGPRNPARERIARTIVTERAKITGPRDAAQEVAVVHQAAEQIARDEGVPKALAYLRELQLAGKYPARVKPEDLDRIGANLLARADPEYSGDEDDYGLPATASAAQGGRIADLGDMLDPARADPSLLKRATENAQATIADLIGVSSASGGMDQPPSPTTRELSLGKRIGAGAARYGLPLAAGLAGAVGGPVAATAAGAAGAALGETLAESLEGEALSPATIGFAGLMGGVGGRVFGAAAKPVTGSVFRTLSRGFRSPGPLGPERQIAEAVSRNLPVPYAGGPRVLGPGLPRTAARGLRDALRRSEDEALELLYGPRPSRIP